ncbi:MAG: helix-turn-helix domain-containing protein [Clostridia bacterium]|nr:helix-turn-helix domain-containing protein [Clostridia bacterium]
MLGDKIKMLRKKRKMSQNELAEKLYVSRALVTKWELGKRYPQRDVLEKMAGIFDMSYEDLIKDDRNDLDAREELSGDLGEDAVGESGGDETIVRAMADKISTFLKTLPPAERKIFIRRYYYYDTVDEISASNGKNVEIVRTTLSEIRLRLINYLEKEGF